MQSNVDVTVQSSTKPTLFYQDLKRSQMGSIEIGAVELLMLDRYHAKTMPVFLQHKYLISG